MLSVISNSFRERRPSSRRLLARSARTGINIRPRLSEETSSSPPSFPFSLSLVVFYILVRSREDAGTRGENALFCAEPRSLHRGDHSSWVGGDFFFFVQLPPRRNRSGNPLTHASPIFVQRTAFKENRTHLNTTNLAITRIGQAYQPRGNQVTHQSYCSIRFRYLDTRQAGGGAARAIVITQPYTLLRS